MLVPAVETAFHRRFLEALKARIAALEAKLGQS